ncbi:hypothetical protein [Vibrio ezurae]|uniref:Uncharacterized protein n=1 Tax=Vibrio ezurae NBRC 102218 TaxID=1219080 RepID=U3B2S2_9VIBR|nr:hypothetical protein [Vibrio ezurae]GAD80255.1 hypothetical protein VEZ01S_28_00380 [Vibrio ezurae NBRC 102218]
MKTVKSFQRKLATSILLPVLGFSSLASAAIDNSSLNPTEFREHVATYGLVYRLPDAVNETLNKSVVPLVDKKLVELKLTEEQKTKNIPHITVVHIHSADPSTPEKMLEVLPTPPKPLTVTLQDFTITEAAKGAGHPWWVDLGVNKQGKGYNEMMDYNTVATAALAPLRDGPLPRVTGPVYANMSDAGKKLVRNVGVSGVNVSENGKTLAVHNPHNTLVYSMTRLTPALQASLDDLAVDLNKAQPEGIKAEFKDISIVQLGFAGNVFKEIYRIDLANGKVTDMRK